MRRTACWRILPLLTIALSLLASPSASGEDPLTGPPNGPRKTDAGWHALTHATVHVKPGHAREDVTVVVRGGEVVSVSPAPPPAGARVWDLSGHHVYAAFVDAYVPVTAPRPEKGAAGEHWSGTVTPRRSALAGPRLTKKEAKELRELGFASAALAPKGGVFRGTGALVSLGEPEPETDPPPVYLDPVYQSVGFDTVRRSDGGGYPDSQMGAIALIRQTLLDADWKSRGGGDGVPNALDALARGDRLLFDTGDELEALRAAKIAKELGREAAILGSGTEFRRIDAIRATGLSFILPLVFPKKPKVASVGEADAVDLRKLMAWEQAPTNPRRLDAAGVTTALTTAKLKDREKFRERLLDAMKHGLSEDRALAMLTTHPARILGMADRLGTVARGRIANLLVTDGPVFSEKTRIRYIFIDGKPEEIRPPRLTGTWELTATPALPEALALLFDDDDGLALRRGDEEKRARKAKVDGELVSFAVPDLAVFSGIRLGETIRGDALRPDGRGFRWSAKRVSPEGPKPEKWKEEEKGPDLAGDVPETYGLPFGPYARAAPPERPAALVVSGATIWTCGPKGVIEDGVLIVAEGKVVYAGSFGDEAKKIIKALPGRPVTVRAKGKHLTPGIIDCHSHTGISKGVNESGTAVTSEVRIKDVTNPDDINWYRQLAGGVVAVNQLHGSANPIGGQNCVVKLRWGAAHPDEMHFLAAPPGIKFALGENVKQSNWGDEFKTRYPQTRMGVETLIRDRFTAARELAAARAAWKKSGRKGPGPRRDLRLEALAEILAGERLVHCHSYRQDEILMLCRVAGDFGFKIGTFQHVLEGYKVAEAIRENAIGASCFSDWWAYKVEVQDAIPSNGALMHDVGVVVTFNSDSSELARRLNVEAAKAMKYGGVPPTEALKFITLNAAIQLGVQDRVGSLEPGKDADFAIWSGPPLSTLSRCEQTWIDGRRYFSLEEDREHRKRIAAERRRLIEKALKAKDEDEWGPPGKKGKHDEYSCHEREGGAR